MRNLTQYRSRPNSLWDFMNEFERAFDSAWTTEPKTDQFLSFSPTVDVMESPDHYLISADLPGMSEKDIKIDVHLGQLTISGERAQEHKKETEDLKFFERSFGKFSRSFSLPKEVNMDKIQARFDNGVLEVFVPKTEKSQPKNISIEAAKGGLFSKLLGEKKTVSKNETKSEH